MHARVRRALLCGAVLTAWAPAAFALKPEPPLSVALRVVSADPARGRYRIEMRLRAGVPLTEAALVVRVRPRSPAATEREPLRASAPSVEPIELPPAREVRRQAEILTLPNEPVVVMVGIGGTVGRARLHRTASLDLGPPGEADLPGRVRTDQDGRQYFEVRMAGAERRP